MIVLGLTGSIGMGKSTTADLFRAAGVPVHDADATVHALYRGPAVAAIEAAFPGTTRDGGVDRAALGARVLGDDAAVKRLEAIVHPLVRAAETAFLGSGRRATRPRPRPPRRDGGDLRTHPRPPDAGRREASPFAFPGRQRTRPRPGPPPGRGDPARLPGDEPLIDADRA